ncbi:hypothetical protein [Pseudomonas umsongensis]|uniref:hypothetical protein n=1 Tax=Pseudomonas umsongensis TaxID=198618 RepID=UPI00200B94C0|nr:hypothetical protein [Pseudomonas umsongensis]MCK8658926.1 hypothetical protein [Pseudomonas umsongensis]
MQGELEKTTDELLLDLADQLLHAGEIRFSGPVTKAGRIERASAWLERLLRDIKLSICVRPEVVAYLHDKDAQNKVNILAVVVDYLTACKLSIPVGTLAALIVKERLDSLCA